MKNTNLILFILVFLFGSIGGSVSSAKPYTDSDGIRTTLAEYFVEPTNCSYAVIKVFSKINKSDILKTVLCSTKFIWSYLQ